MAKGKNRHSTAITGIGSLGNEYRYPKNYKRASRGQFNAVFGSGKTNEAGTAGSAIGSAIGKLIARRSAAVAARSGGAGAKVSRKSVKTERQQSAARSSATPGPKKIYQGVSKATGGPTKSKRPTKVGPASPTPSQKAQLSMYQAGRKSVSAAKKTSAKQDKARLGRKAAGYGAGFGAVAAGAGATSYNISVSKKQNNRPSSGKPKVGDTKMLGGRKARYDGKNWVATR